jgi:hypothetical protein
LYARRGPRQGGAPRSDNARPGTVATGDGNLSGGTEADVFLGDFF